MLVNFNIFSGAQLQTLHEKTLYLLETTGIAMQHQPTLDLLARHGATVDGKVVKIPSKLVEEAIASAPSEFTLIGRDRAKSVRIGNGSLIIAPTGGEVFVHDIDGGRREATLQDLTNFLKLCQTSDVIGVTDCDIVDPNELAGNAKVCLSMMEGIKNSDKPLEGFSIGTEQSDLCLQMTKIATQPAGDEHYIMAIVNPLSPLGWDDNMLEALWAFCSANQPVVITCCSMGGSSAPVNLTGGIIQNNVEILAGVVIAQLIRQGSPVIYGNTSSIADMRTMSLATGAPEAGLMEAAACQLARFYHLPFRGGGGMTDAKEVDVQAGVESTTNLFCAYASQADYVLHGVGMMDGFLTVSYEKWIVDEEICGRMQRFFKGMDDISEAVIQTIQDVGPRGSYLMHKSTVQSYKKEFYMPKISDRNNWDKWIKGNISIMANANRAWKKRLAEFTAPALAPEVERELAAFIDQHI
jgi:trimethylamine--corrinoid protein Co-methyltransferase